MSLAEGLLLDGLYDPPIVAQDVYIAKRSDSSPGAGTISNPYSGNSAAQVDAVLGGLQPNSTLHFGPGSGPDAFLTNGNVGYSLPNSVRIVGAGRDVTTIKLSSGAYA